MLCPFCQGRRRFFYLRLDRPAWWRCKPCEGTGVKQPDGPEELRLGQAQNRFLKPYKDTP